MTEMCRVCLNKRSSLNIFKTQKEDKETTSSKLMYLAKVQIHPNDGLPNSICIKCLRKLDMCIQFIKQCENSERKLRLLLADAECLDSKESNDTSNDQKYDLLGIGEYSLGSENKDVDNSNTDYKVSKSEIKCEENYKQEENFSDLKINKNKKQQCFKCGRVMSSRFRLKTHLRTHTGEKPFSCLICNKTFTLEQNLKVHIRIHTGEKPLQCSICGASFAQSAGLVAHKRKHTGQTPYKCVLCTRSFRTWGHLQYHVRRHTGEKNFECDICGRAFITRSDMKQHIKIHTGDKPHVCCICGLRVARASHLKRHMQCVHSDKVKYSCPKCLHSFWKISELENHQKMHKDEHLEKVTS